MLQLMYISEHTPIKQVFYLDCDILYTIKSARYELCSSMVCFLVISVFRCIFLSLLLPFKDKNRGRGGVLFVDISFLRTRFKLSRVENTQLWRSLILFNLWWNILSLLAFIYLLFSEVEEVISIYSKNNLKVQQNEIRK